MTDTIWSYADKQIAKLKKRITARFHNLALARWDELNVISVRQRVGTLYEQLEKDNRNAMESVAKKAYEDAARECGYAPSRTYAAEVASLVAVILSSPNKVTKYVYDNEVDRKRDRTVESILSEPAKVSSARKAIEDSLARSTRLWYDQSRQYIDTMVDESRVKAFEDAGVKQVMWVSERDGRVCETCKSLDGTIFDLAHRPNKAHIRCRCKLVPVLKPKP